VGESLRVGVIGCGAIASAVHLRVLRGLRGVRVTAVADPLPAARDRGSRLVSAAAVETTDQLLARDDVDAVVVTTPSGTHAGIALATLAAGRHLFLEKPIATSLHDGQQVAAAAAARDCIATIGFNWRFQPLIMRAREILCDGVLGEIHSVSTTFCEPAPIPTWKERRRDGGGVLLDLGSHHFDLIRWLLGTEVRVVQASLRSELSEHDSAEVRLGLDGDGEASVSLSFRSGPVDTINVTGERGSLHVDRYARTLVVRGVRTRTTTLATIVWRTKAFVRPRAEPSWNTLLRKFVHATRGAAVDLPTFGDALRSLEVVVAAERAAGIG